MNGLCKSVPNQQATLTDTPGPRGDDAHLALSLSAPSSTCPLEFVDPKTSALHRRCPLEAQQQLNRNSLLATAF